MKTLLTDFTRDELRAAYIAIGMYLEQNEVDKERTEALEKWKVQIVHAAGLLAVEDKIKSN